MEELIGRRVKITLNNAYGIVIVSGEVLKIDSAFVLVQTLTGPIYFSVYHIKTIELVAGE